LTSERDSTETIYNLFEHPTWSNTYKLDMFNLPLLKEIVDKKQAGQACNTSKHQEIVSMLKYVAGQFEIEIPPHWL